MTWNWADGRICRQSLTGAADEMSGKSLGKGLPPTVTASAMICESRDVYLSKLSVVSEREPGMRKAEARYAVVDVVGIDSSRRGWRCFDPPTGLLQGWLQFTPGS